MTRIVVIIPGMTVGGAQRFVLRLIEAIGPRIGERDEPIEWHVVSFALDGPLVDQIPAFVSTHDLHCRGRSAFFPLRRFLKETRPDTVVAIQGYVGVLTALVRPMTGRFRLVVRETSLPSHKGVSGLRLALYRWGYRRFDRIVCQSRDMGDDVQRLFRVPASLIAIIPNGLPRPTGASPDGRSRKGGARAAASLPRRYIVSVGRLDAVKDLPLLIESFAVVAARDSGLDLVIVGDGALGEALQRDVERRGLADRVVCTGRLASPEAVVSAAAATVMTSRYEGFPNVLLESLRLGVPITGVVSPGGVREIYREGINGYFSEARDPAAVAAAIIATITRPWDRGAMIADLYRRFDLQAIAAAYLDTFLGRRRIALLINSLQQGGAERVCSLIAEALPRYRWELELILLENERFYPLPSDTPLYVVNQQRLPRWRKVLALPGTLARLRRTVARGRYDQVLSFLAFPNVLNVLLKRTGGGHKAIISSRTDPARLLGEGYSGRLQRWAMRRWYPRADRHVSLTERMEHTLRTWGALPLSSFVIPNPYDLGTIRRSAIEADGATRNEYSRHPERFHIVSVGRLIPLKRYEEIVAAIAVLPTVHLTVIGDGPSARSIRDAAERNGVTDRVVLTGRLTNPFPVVASADLYVLTSETEGFPNAMVEAMVLGVPVVATDCPTGPREILAPELQPDETPLPDALYFGSYGVLIAVGDVSGLSQAIRRFSTDRDLLREYAVRVRSRSEDFAMEGVLASYDTMLRAR